MTRSHRINLRYRHGLILIAAGLCITCGGKSSFGRSDADGKNAGDGGASVGGDQSTNEFELDSIAEQQHRELLMAAWSIDLPLPADQRDIPPTWEGPPTLDKTSSTPFCAPFEFPPRLVGMHADDRGLFVGVARHCDETLDGKRPCDPIEGSALFQRSSSEWKVLATPATRFEPMRALPNGTFFFGASVLFDLERGVQIIENPYYNAHKFQVVPTGDTAFLIAMDELRLFQPSHTFVARLESNAWIQRTTLDGGWRSVAGDQSGNLFIDGRELLVGQPESLTTVEGPPESTVLGSIWAESPTNFWFATDDGQIWHYNGAFEALFDASDNEYTSISLYHDGDRPYVMTPSVFGYFTDSGFTTVSSLLDTPTRSFTALTAANGDGVYVALLDRKLEQYRCGSLVIMRFDGAKFERI